MEKYLYGAAVQGIQNFIFKTDKLKEIAGASELVERICTTEFAEALGKKEEDLEKDLNSVVNAAGNIKYIFDDISLCEKIVKYFPKKIMEFAPGITISQAVVPFPGDKNPGKKQFDELEKKLRVQRNKPFRPFDVGLMAENHSRKTGLPSVKYIKKDNEYIDLGVLKKREVIDSEIEGVQKYGRLVKKFFGSEIKRIPLDLKEITESKSNYSWLAVLHADGNNMGLIMQKMAEEIKSSGLENYKDIFRKFSVKIDEATKNAAQAAYKKTIENNKEQDSSCYQPCRPVIIGGDDLTIIIRANLALPFSKNFLFYFEKETKKQFSDMHVNTLKDGLTACIGIAFIKDNYPFHYGYNLAESLCNEAKKRAKENTEENLLTPSCLMFHKVQGSFIEKYSDICNRELTIHSNEKEPSSKEIKFDYGPYYLDKDNGKPSIDNLQNCVGKLEGKDGNIIKSHLRQWLTYLYYNQDLAHQKMKRFCSFESSVKEIKTRIDELHLSEIEKNGNKIPVYDWLIIRSIN